MGNQGAGCKVTGNNDRLNRCPRFKLAVRKNIHSQGEKLLEHFRLQVEIPSSELESYRETIRVFSLHRYYYIVRYAIRHDVRYSLDSEVIE